MAKSDTVRVALVLAGAVTAGVGTFDYLSLTGTYLYPVRFGATRLWEDATTGCLRVKRGSDPSSETDGTILMEG